MAYPEANTFQGNIPKAPGTIPINRRPAEAEIQRLETELRGRFDAHVRKLCILYYLGEKYNIEHLLNNTISIIQDSFYEYGTVFGPALLILVFKDTQKGSKLRELCLAANVIHIDRGCEKLRGELIMASLMTDDCFANMMTWISRNFAMFGRRQTEGYDVMKPTQGFNSELVHTCMEVVTANLIMKFSTAKSSVPATFTSTPTPRTHTRITRSARSHIGLVATRTRRQRAWTRLLKQDNPNR